VTRRVKLKSKDAAALEEFLRSFKPLQKTN
jgi:hypothetical protein